MAVILSVHPPIPGVDEISIRKGQTYRIVVSDLDRRFFAWSWPMT
jgi:hypothetical protein